MRLVRMNCLSKSPVMTIPSIESQSRHVAMLAG
jgi:hypothetical protein